MPARKFIFDSSKGEVVEVTPEANRAVCDAISKDTAKRKRPLVFGLPRTSKSKRASTWPRVSDFLACDVEDVAAEQAELRKHGVTTEYEIKGHNARPIFRDQSHRYRHHRALGFADGDAGYGDPAPLNFTSKPKKKPHRSVEEIRRERTERMEEIKRVLASWEK